MASAVAFFQMAAYTAAGGVVHAAGVQSGAVAAGVTKLATHAVIGGDHFLSRF